MRKHEIPPKEKYYDSLSDRIRKAISKCDRANEDAVFVTSFTQLKTTQRILAKLAIPYIQRKQECGGWLLFPYASSKTRSEEPPRPQK